jgi:ribonucleoside-diphosphate reductase alpha chain
VRDEHLPVFDCAFKPRNGQRFIAYPAHIRMMAAVQPFLSGAISKTVNMPNEATVEEIEARPISKAGSSASRPWPFTVMVASAASRSARARTKRRSRRNRRWWPLPPRPSKRTPTVATGPRRPLRRRMPSTRQSLTHKFDIAGHEGYLTVGLYDDGHPGELFITMAKEGSTVGGLMDAFGTAISMCLQYGVPVKSLVEKFAHTRFEPSGFTKNPDIPIAKSLPDYIFRWFGMEFLDGYKEPQAGKTLQLESGDTHAGLTTVAQVMNAAPASPASAPAPAASAAPATPAGRIDDQFQHFMEDAPACDNCGAITVRNGACYKCFNCGNSMGCS